MDEIEATGAAISATSFPVVCGETQQLSNVFQNLVSNALKYRREEVAPQLHISVECHDEQIVVAVQDNGIGFEQQYAEQIFGLFPRLHKEEYAGTGLGLAICNRNIERYGGRIWAEGRPGEGATFFFSLPPAIGLMQFSSMLYSRPDTHPDDDCG
ncbi:MAG: sensor histidine kinase [Bryobacteraceae bacterium]